MEWKVSETSNSCVKLCIILRSMRTSLFVQTHDMNHPFVQSIQAVEATLLLVRSIISLAVVISDHGICVQVTLTVLITTVKHRSSDTGLGYQGIKHGGRLTPVLSGNDIGQTYRKKHTIHLGLAAICSLRHP